MIHVVTYVYDPKADEATTRLRPAHRDFLARLHSQGHLRASGPWVGGDAGAYLLMATDTAEQALEILDDDPFWAAGVIAHRSVQGWNPVIGELA